ncbi:lytic transglycosylase domain-containing protein [Solidesulfovibrio carbinoliphilus]|uniref:lytic transglycosylase domain-containing protein n=1 Tax=Solidesulfovibrio carbinoliphilus TaxID=345370 RepID=UPI00031016BC|nr:lytic transglycosylase domain-containing protein [Solidesulfovibrio carbinoliphilus]
MSGLVLLLVLALGGLTLPGSCPAGQAAAWEPPRKPGDIPLPRSARLAASGPETARTPAGPRGPGRPGAAEVALGATEVLAGRHAEGAARLAASAAQAGTLADVAAYYRGLGLYLADDPAGAGAALAALAATPAGSFLGRDALYLALESAARRGDHGAALALAESWLTEADPTLAPEVWLRAAVAADGLGQDRKAADFLRHLSLTWPASRSAVAGNALARTICGNNAWKNASGGQGVAPDASGGQGAALDPPGGIIPPGPPERGEGAGVGTAGMCYDPDAPGNVLMRAEKMAEKAGPEDALTLLDNTRGFDAGQALRAAYVRGKALYRLRRFKAAAEAFGRVAAADPAASLSGWARYHEARCLWRSFEPEDIDRMEALLRQVLAAPVRDDPLREAAARHLALLLAERGRFADALAAAGQLRGLAVPADLAAQGASLAAVLRYVVGDMEGAAEDMAAFIRRFPGDDWADGARYWRGRALLVLGRPSEATAVWLEALSRRPNTYYGGRARAALAGLGLSEQAVAASPVTSAPRCPGRIEEPSATAEAALDKARTLSGAGLPALAEMELEFAARAEPARADLAMAHIEAAAAMGRRGAVSQTAWRTFGGCLLRGTAEDLAPLRQALYPRAYAPQVEAALAGSDIRPDTVYSLIRQESFFDPLVVSGAGAVGLMQLMPETARTVGKKIGIRAERQDLFNPMVNIRLGVAFFRERLGRAGSLAAALAGYNAGENRAAIWVRHLAPLGEELFTELIPYTETRDYVRRITANAMMYGRLYGR